MSLREEILEAIIQRAAQVMKLDQDQLNADSSFEALGFKSGNIVQLTTFLEDKYDVEVPFMDFRRKKTFGEAADYVKTLVEG